MSLVPAICTQCGAQIEVDNSHEAGVCKHCGTAFITEKAINNYNNSVTNNININSSGNTVNIIGTSDKSDNYLQIARRAKENDDVEKAEKFYNLVLESYPDNWEANFYSTYYSIAQTNIGNIPASALKFRNSLGLVIELLKNDTDTEQIIKSVNEIKDKIFYMCATLYDSYKSYFLQFRGNASICQSYNMAVLAITSVLYHFGDLLAKFFDNEEVYIEIAIESWKKALEIRKAYFKDNPVYCNSGAGDTKISVQEEVNRYSSKIQKYDASYVAPEVKGCYIATCIYGSYDCPQVWTLRRFRDYTLDATWYGRLFIKCYYAISPMLVKWFGETKWFRRFWKSKLDKMVSDLNDKGVDNTYYKDKY